MKAEGFFNKVSDAEVDEAKKDAKDKGIKICFIEVTLDDDLQFEGIFREPNNAVVTRYVSQANNPKSDGMAHHNAFVRDCIITPTRDEYFELLKERPALSLSISPRLIEGHGLANDSKKKSL